MPQTKKLKARKETNLRWKYLLLKNNTNIAERGTAQIKDCHKGVDCLRSEMTKTTTAKTQTKETASAVMQILLRKLNSAESSLI